MEKLSSEDTSSPSLPLGQVLLVFFLPLIVAAGLVIWVLRASPALAEHPGYLLLAALGVAAGMIALVWLITSRGKHPAQGK